MSCVVPARERRSSQTPPAVCVLVGIVGSLPLFHRLLKREEALSHPLSSASSLSAFGGSRRPPRALPDRRERPAPLQGIFAALRGRPNESGASLLCVPVPRSGAGTRFLPLSNSTPHPPRPLHRRFLHPSITNAHSIYAKCFLIRQKHAKTAHFFAKKFTKMRLRFWKKQRNPFQNLTVFSQKAAAPQGFFADLAALLYILRSITDSAFSSPPHGHIMRDIGTAGAQLPVSGVV